MNITITKEISRLQNATLKKKGKGKNVKYAPYVFTEQGIYMLATVLKGEMVIRQSIIIIRTFKEMRHYINEISDCDIMHSLIERLLV